MMIYILNYIQLYPIHVSYYGIVSQALARTACARLALLLCQADPPSREGEADEIYRS